MAVTAFDGQFSFRQDSLARLGHTGGQRLSQGQMRDFQNSPFMQGVRKTEDLCWRFTSARDQMRSKSDNSFHPKDSDFNAPKAHDYEKTIDYYKVLGISEHATLDEVKKAYRKLSLVYHPDKTAGMDQEQKDEHAAVFIQLKNAYRTLSDNPTRRQYDRDRDRDKASFEVNGYKVKTQVHFDATEVLKKLQEMQRKPGRVVDVQVRCKLEKFVFGGHKSVQRPRSVMVMGCLRSENKLYRIDIPPGASEPRECPFRNQGDHHLDTRPDTLNFIVSSKPHSRVERDGDDLHLRRALEPVLEHGDSASETLAFEVQTVPGRHILVWGDNPLYGAASRRRATVRFRIAGEGVGAGRMHFSCYLGAREPSSSSTAPACAADATVSITQPTASQQSDAGFGASYVEFLRRHQLGPKEDPLLHGTDNCNGGQHAACGSHSALLRRWNRRTREEASYDVELEAVGQPITLFTQPACTLRRYATSKSEGNCPAPDRPGLNFFAIAMSSPACASRKAAAQWEQLKASIVPLLWATTWLLVHAARAILPRPLAAEPLVPRRDAAAQHAHGEAAEIPCMPWKRLADEAFHRGDYFTAMAMYTRCFPDGCSSSDETIDVAAVALSNRAACLAKVGHYEASLADARKVLELRPTWSRGWSRVGLAASELGVSHQKEALDAYFRAVEFDPESSRVESLKQTAAKTVGQCKEAAHEHKERGNAAMRVNDWGLAVACYTVALALTPAPADQTPRAPAEPQRAEDEHSFLRSVLYSNRAAALMHCRKWHDAVADARQAVASKSDFVKARCRLGAALLAIGSAETAYVEFARALQLERANDVALKGRDACLSTLPRWNSLVAHRRLQDRFYTDLQRPAGSTKVYAISDVHFDHRCNEDWVNRIDDLKFQEDVLVVAGNLCDAKNALVRALTTLRGKFRRVFYVPGNHEFWLHPTEAARYPDSIAKFLSILEACDEIGVDVSPAAVCQGVFVVPLLSWYNAEFDEADPLPDIRQTFDSYCKWPLDPDTQVWKYMLRLNEAHLARPYHGTVVTFSHFLPRRSLPFGDVPQPSGNCGKPAKAMGCTCLDEQIRAARSSVHIYGHSTRRHSVVEDGVCYVNRYHGPDRGKFQEDAPLLCVHDGQKVVQLEVPM